MRYVFITLGWIWVGLSGLALLGILLAHPWGPMLRVDTEAARVVMMQEQLVAAIVMAAASMFPGLLIAGIGHMIGRRA